MPRQARINEEYLHIIVRGIGKQVLFESDEDRIHYLNLMKRYRDDCEIIILAYCLMENHVHLLLKDPKGITSEFMKKMGISYALYYNKKYDRTGHLFQDRYKSENIRNDEGLLAVYRYILNNPGKAGIASPQNYKWSSYQEYDKKTGLTDSSILRKMIGNRENFQKFLKNDDEEEFMEDMPVKHDDEWAIKKIKMILGVSSGTVLQQMSKSERDENLAKLRKAGLTVRQIERLTGINRGIVQMAKADKQNRPC